MDIRLINSLETISNAWHQSKYQCKPKCHFMDSNTSGWSLSSNVILEQTSGVRVLTALSCPLEVLHHGVVMDPTQDLLLHQTELLSRGQLPLAWVACKTGQVVGISPRTAHPVAGVNLPPASGTLSTKPTVRERNGEQHRERKRWKQNERWGLKAAFAKRKVF